MSTRVSLVIAAAFSATAPGDASTKPAACTAPNVSASIARAITPNYPDIAQWQGAGGTVVVRVDLSETGKLLSASVARSSGSPILDMAAVQTAKQMTYTPELRSCEPVAGSYTVDVEYP
jgi:protein TonB